MKEILQVNKKVFLKEVLKCRSDSVKVDEKVKGVKSVTLLLMNEREIESRWKEYFWVLCR